MSGDGGATLAAQPGAAAIEATHVANTPLLPAARTGAAVGQPRFRARTLFLLGYFVFALLPIYWMVNMSFKTNGEIVSSFTLLPQHFTRLPVGNRIDTIIVSQYGAAEKQAGQNDAGKNFCFHHFPPCINRSQTGRKFANGH